MDTLTALRLLLWVLQPAPTGVNNAAGRWELFRLTLDSHRTEHVYKKPIGRHDRNLGPLTVRFRGVIYMTESTFLLNVLKGLFNHLAPLERVAVATGPSRRRFRKGIRYGSGWKTSHWSGNNACGISRNLANAVRLLTGEYPTDARMAFGALRQSKEY